MYSFAVRERICGREARFAASRSSDSAPSATVTIIHRQTRCGLFSPLAGSGRTNSDRLASERQVLGQILAQTAPTKRPRTPAPLAGQVRTESPATPMHRPPLCPKVFRWAGERWQKGRTKRFSLLLNLCWPPNKSSTMSFRALEGTFGNRHRGNLLSRFRMPLFRDCFLLLRFKSLVKGLVLRRRL